MCGITGFIDLKRATSDVLLRERVKTMSDALRHRGPDDSGVWSDAAAGVALGHRRLSILDLSAEGHQPMSSVSGRYVITFNGEIYNFAELRSTLELEGAPGGWRGHSDTEALLAAVERWGIEGTLKVCNGMFAIAIWDRLEGVLTIARDRLGEKPLYYGLIGDTFFFASELKALRTHPAFRADLDIDAAALFLRHNYIPAPHCIYKGMKKLEPAHLAELRPEAGEIAAPRPYWSARGVAERGVRDPYTGSDPVGELDRLLSDSVALRTLADVPVGAFLSGGIDSSTVVALMQQRSARPIRTFTIGFHERGFDEAVYARGVADHLGTDHTELYVTPRDAMAVIPMLPSMYDEPFADSSQIPTFLVSRLARSQVTVALSGDGGDELFGGYHRYFFGRRIWDVLGKVPAPARPLLSKAIRRSGAWAETAARLLPRQSRIGQLASKAKKVSEFVALDSAEKLYRGLLSHCEPETLMIGSREPLTSLMNPEYLADLPDFTQRMMYLDMISYLPDDILVKVDRASMAVALEARVPFLDHRVVEFAWRLPMTEKVVGGEGKLILKKVLARYVPSRFFDRPKVGFGVPIGTWLRGPLREWAEQLLEPVAMRRVGILDAGAVQEKWREHLSGTQNWQYYLWNILILQAWLADNQFF